MVRKKVGAIERYFDSLFESYLDSHKVIGHNETQLIEEVFELYPGLEKKYQCKFKKSRSSF